jgi:hypothetical protein
MIGEQEQHTMRPRAGQTTTARRYLYGYFLLLLLERGAVSLHFRLQEGSISISTH